MNRSIRLIALLFLLLIGGCSSPPPGEEGFVLSLGRSPVLSDAQEEFEPLVVRWLGTASFHIGAGELSVLTDPFFSHQTAFRTGFRQLVSNPKRVRALLKDLPEPQAILVSHSHYDHILDLAPAMRLHDWRGAEVFGSATADHILSAYPDKYRWRFRRVSGRLGWSPTAVDGLRLKPLTAGHAPQVGNRLLYPGRISKRLEAPPSRARDFLAGEVLAYLLELDAGAQTHRVVFLGSTPTLHRELARELRASAPIDALFLPVASWDKVDGYPSALISALRPRYILLSHFNNFFDPRNPRRILKSADLDGMLRAAQNAVSSADYPNFERIIVPDIGVPLTLH